MSTAPHILIVEDEPDIVELIRYNLERAGYRVRAAMSGDAGLRDALAHPPGMVVLDRMMPGLDGLQVCRALRAEAGTETVPILMLTARGAEADVVAGLEAGADDYVVKPFSPKVLIARVRALLRRVTPEVAEPAASASAPAPGNVIAHYGIELDPGRRRVTVEGVEVTLTRTEFDLLEYLLKRPGWVFTRNQIVDGIKGTGHPVTERSVDVQVAALRKKLGPRGSVVETVRGVGYRVAE
ncbi:MAG: response regulator transcription factor [Nitrospirota bacterium]|nr:response regulator transcription factor [Nitrospirota bacterium]